MLTDFFILEVEDMDSADIHFQQDGATCLTTKENMSLLRNYFPGKQISRFGDVKLLVRSPDLSPLDFLLWANLKERVHRDNPQALTELKEAIDKEIMCIGSEMTKAVFDSMKKSAQDYIQSGGHHLKNFVFKK